MQAAKTTAYMLHRGDSILPHRPAMLQFHSHAQQPLPNLGPPGDRLHSAFPVMGVGHHPLIEITTLSKEQAPGADCIWLAGSLGIDLTPIPREQVPLRNFSYYLL